MKRARLAVDGVLSCEPDCLPQPAPGRSVRIDGALTHIRHTAARRPGAEPALYVHGLGGSSQNWTDLADLLAERVARCIEHAARGPVHLFGNSLGGAVSICVAAHRPDLVRTLTLISPAMPFLDPRRSLHGRFLPILLVPRADRLASRQLAAVTPAELTRLVIEACFADVSRFPEQRMAEAVEEARLRYTVPWYTTAYVRSLRGLVGSFLRAYLPGSGSLWRIAARVQAPTLVIAGYRDRLVNIKVAPQVAAAIPDSRLLILDGVGHVAQMEVPRLVARAVWALLDEVGASPATPLAACPTRARPTALPSW